MAPTFRIYGGGAIIQQAETVYGLTLLPYLKQFMKKTKYHEWSVCLDGKNTVKIPPHPNAESDTNNWIYFRYLYGYNGKHETGAIYGGMVGTYVKDTDTDKVIVVPDDPITQSDVDEFNEWLSSR